MRMYRCFLVVLMVAAIGFGIWYCTNFYPEQRSVKDGTLVLLEKQPNSDEMRGEWMDVWSEGICESEWTLYCL